jgi:hypothetical protein
MRKWIAALVIVALCGLCEAKAVWTAGTVGNGDEFGVIGGVRPSADAKTEYRVEVLYLDGIRENTQRAFCGALGATYDVIDTNTPFAFPWGLAKGTVALRCYLGGCAGLVGNIEGATNYDALAAGLAGVSMGDAVNRIGVEALLPVRLSSWNQLANLDDTSVLRAVIIHRF